MKVGFEVRSWNQRLDTDLNRDRDLTGSRERMSATVS